MTVTAQIGSVCVALLLISPLSGSASARDASGDRVAKPVLRITNYGRYASEGGELVPHTGTSGGVTINGARAVLVETTRSIPCSVGETWGFEFQLLGLPEGRPYRYRSEMHHPPIPQPNGEDLSVSVVERVYQSGDPPPRSESWGFLAEFAYELVPGTWTRKIFVDGSEVASFAFEIVGPVRLEPTPPVDRGLVLGIQYRSVPPELARRLHRNSGAYVLGVFEGMPATNLLEPGDVIIRVADFEIGTVEDLVFLLDEIAGRDVTVMIIRRRKIIAHDVSLLSRPSTWRTSFAPTPPASIHAAVINHDPLALESLLDSELDIDATDERGHSPLHLAASRGDVGMLRRLLDRGASVNRRDRDSGSVALHFAAAEGHLVASSLLLSRGANANSSSNGGATALHIAAASGRPEMVRLLLGRGAEVNARTHSGRTPLHEAASENRSRVVNLLLARGAEIDVAEALGRTPLHAAAQNGNLGIVKILVNTGRANVNALYKGNSRPHDLAKAAGHDDVAKYLSGRLKPRQ